MPSREENYRRWLQVQGIDPATAPALGPDPLADRDVPAQVVPGESGGIMDILTSIGGGLKKVFIDPARAAYGDLADAPSPQVGAAPSNPSIRDRAAAGQIPGGSEAFVTPSNIGTLQESAQRAFTEATNPPPPAPTKTPDELYLEEVERKRQMLDGLFPQRQTATAEQQAVDNYAKKDMDRTALLARLAFASGLAKAGGAGWADIGQGLAAAGQVMDQGYARYHQALQNAADRAQKRLDTQYADEASRSSAAVELAAAERTARTDASEKERKRWLDYFGDLKPSDEALLADPEAYDNWRRRYEEFMFTGSTSPYGVTDVRD